MTDWRTILLAADKAEEKATERIGEATSKRETSKWRTRRTRLEQVALLAQLALEYGHTCESADNPED